MILPALAFVVQAVTPQQTPIPAEFRGLSAAGDGVVWASGRNGVYARTLDGGTTWDADTIPGATALFLVDVHAVDALTACVLATSFDGGLGRIYRTTDGGARWSAVYERVQPGVFFDGMAFWDHERGVAFGDPVDDAFLVARTEDGCRAWTEVPAAALPAPLEGEAGFAASGTAIVTAGRSHAWIGTGGAVTARILRTADGGRTWTAHATPLASGPTSGLFGVAFADTLRGLAVGGDHQVRTAGADNVIVTEDGGRTWRIAGTAAPVGVRYGVAFVPGTDGVFVATGPSGYGITRDWGAHWSEIDGAHVNTVAAWGRTAWVAGVEGRVWRLEFSQAP